MPKHPHRGRSLGRVPIGSMKGNKKTLQADKHSIRTLIGVKGKAH